MPVLVFLLHAFQNMKLLKIYLGWRPVLIPSLLKHHTLVHSTE